MNMNIYTCTYIHIYIEVHTHTRLHEASARSPSLNNWVRIYRGAAAALVHMQSSPGDFNVQPGLRTTASRLYLEVLSLAGILDALKLHQPICFHSHKEDNNNGNITSLHLMPLIH